MRSVENHLAIQAQTGPLQIDVRINIRFFDRGLALRHLRDHSGAREAVVAEAAPACP